MLLLLHLLKGILFSSAMSLNLLTSQPPRPAIAHYKVGEEKDIPWAGGPQEKVYSI